MLTLSIGPKQASLPQKCSDLKICDCPGLSSIFSKRKTSSIVSSPSKGKTSVLAELDMRSQANICVEAAFLTLCLKTSSTSFKTQVAVVTVVQGGRFPSISELIS